MDLATLLAKEPSTLTPEEKTYLEVNMAVTTWRPDTCDCTIHYAWDKSLPLEQRVHIPVDSVTTYDKRKIDRQACAAHSTHLQKGKHREHHDTILAENQKKNHVLNEIMENTPSLVETVVDAEGNTTKRWKTGAEPSFSFDATRKLKIALKNTGIKAEKDIAKSRIAARFPDVEIT